MTEQGPLMKISKLLFLCRKNQDKNTNSSKILELIRENDMAPLYKDFCEEFKLSLDSTLLTKLETKNTQELQSLDDRLKDVEQNLGETEISDALIAKAHYLAKIGEKDKALSAYRLAIDKTVPLGSRIDLVFSTIRIGFFFNDPEIISKKIDQVKSLIEEGGDWDRRNRLKVYTGIFKVSNRDFKGAANLLIESLASFSSTEFMDFKDFVNYTVLVAAITLDRPAYKKMIIDSPEILEVVHEIPHLTDYTNSLYNCNYAAFFHALAAIEQQLKFDPILHTHVRFYVREMRINCYNQILESYQSLTIESMAKSFGVSADFIDSDLARFIAAGRINAVIDKVGMVVETNRPDAKNAQYQSIIKQGDLLLNRVQKLGVVINI